MFIDACVTKHLPKRGKETVMHNKEYVLLDAVIGHPSGPGLNADYSQPAQRATCEYRLACIFTLAPPFTSGESDEQSQIGSESITNWEVKSRVRICTHYQVRHWMGMA